ncbi:MAG: hypothetical protein KDN18_05995 [Verrucomicrobiae bacterium]|nr:hypothetical protein [Verrucomicrobiae bacterium]
MKTESLVVVSLVVALTALEAVSRVVEPRLSADVRQMLAQNEIADRVREAKNEDRASILVIGNSLARASILPDEIAVAIDSTEGKPPEVLYITPDASGINEWAAAYRKAFAPDLGVELPDLIIIVAGPWHLVDHAVSSPEKLSAYHVSSRDRLDVAWNWFSDIGARCRFALAGVSRLFANRERVQPLLFYGWVPGYEVTAQRLNQTSSLRAEDRSGRDEPASVRPADTTSRLELLLDSLGVEPEQVLIAAVPLPEHYKLPESVVSVARARGINVFTEAAEKEWPASAFPDGYHMSSEAGRAFSRELENFIRSRQNGGYQPSR